jgi:NodT family efflux transporter outer membrane factor (OMF) lipoprotein
VTIPSQLVRTRPDILAAEADLHAATAQVGVETAKLYPDVKLTAGIAQGALKPGDLFSYNATGWNIGPQVSLPIFNGGSLKARRNAASAAADASYARYKQTVLKAFNQVADVMQALVHDDDAVKAQQLAQRLAEANLRDARLAYEKGGGTLLQVLDAQRQLHMTRRGYALAVGQRYSDAARLFVATAADWRASGVPLEKTLP